MKLWRACSLPLAVFLFASSTRADDSNIINLTAGMNANQIVGAAEAGWSLGGNFNCSGSGNQLTVTATGAAPCPGEQRVLTAQVSGGTLNANHTFVFRLNCSSPITSSGSIDGGPFLSIGPGGTAFTSGGDSIVISGVNPNMTFAPTMGEWGLIALGVLIVGAGLVMLRRLPAAPPTAC